MKLPTSWWSTLLHPTALGLSLLQVAVCLAGDTLGAGLKGRRLAAALVDNATHALVGGLAWAVVVVATPLDSHTGHGPLTLTMLFQVSLCAAVASFVDVDHFIEAGSFDLQKATSLKHRPFLHNSTLPIFFWLFSMLIYHVFHRPGVDRMAFLLLLAFLTHHLRDAWRRGLWLGPFCDALPVSYAMYVVATVVLTFSVRVYFLWTKYRDVQQDHLQQQQQQLEQQLNTFDV